MERPLCIDLFCGLFGWGEAFAAEGWDVIGFDIVDMCRELGRPKPEHCQLVLQDVRTMVGFPFRRRRGMVVASSPCPEFSRHQMPWTKRRNPPPPDLSLTEAAFRIAHEAGFPIVLENVRAAQQWLGPARAHYGSRYLWGDVPLILPEAERSFKERLSSSRKADRAKIPPDLAQWIARVFKP